MAHPYGVQPLGNAVFADPKFPDARISGLGVLARLRDETLTQILSFLRPEEAARFCVLSKAAYILASQESLWRDYLFGVLQTDEKIPWEWKGTWRDSYRVAVRKHRRMTPEEVPGAKFQVRNFFSDDLFIPWLTSQFRIPDSVWGALGRNTPAAAANGASEEAREAKDPEIRKLKSWLQIENIPRRSNLSYEEFVREYERPNKPVIITDGISDWPALAEGNWTPESLVQNYGDVSFTCRGHQMTLKNLIAYVKDNQDEMPLYLFDYAFGERAPGLIQDYRVPEYFDHDLFQVMGESRPNFRWWLIGGQRSGSSWHQDPNYTSAFNAAVLGRKKWILYPPQVVPPGIIPSEDGVDVTVPLSIVEWFENFYQLVVRSPKDLPKSSIAGKRRREEIVHSWDVDTSSGHLREFRRFQKMRRSRRGLLAATATGPTPIPGGHGNLTYENVAPLECILNPGEVLFIPSGWWHTVLNLDSVCVAVTQNFLNESNFFDVGEFVTGHEGLISGYMNQAEEDGEEGGATEEEAEEKERKEMEKSSAEGMNSSTGKAQLWERLLEALQREKPEAYQKLMAIKAQEEAATAQRKQAKQEHPNSGLSALFQQNPSTTRRKRLKGAHPEEDGEGDGFVLEFDLS